MITFTKDIRDLLKKEAMLNMQFLCLKITILNNYHGEAMSSKNSTEEANQLLPLEREDEKFRKID
jgi:hypothetical protein